MKFQPKEPDDCGPLLGTDPDQAAPSETARALGGCSHRWTAGLHDAMLRDFSGFAGSGAGSALLEAAQAPSSRGSGEAPTAPGPEKYRTCSAECPTLLSSTWASCANHAICRGAKDEQVLATEEDRIKKIQDAWAANEGTSLLIAACTAQRTLATPMP